MATKNKKTSKSKSKASNNQDVIKLGKISIAKQKLIKIGIVIVTSIIVVWFVNSSFWPWPSSAEIGRRLNEVIDACMYNERSRGCSTIQEKYNLSFEYCHSLADVPEIGKDIPIYGVAKKSEFISKKIADRSGDKTYNKYPYYGCVDNLDNIDKNDQHLLASEPRTMAMFDLYHTPQYSIIGDTYKCTIKLNGYGFLWDQIPNIETIKKDYDVVAKTYKSCRQLSEIRSELDKINTKLSSYTKNPAVQLYYYNYDDWSGVGEGRNLLTCSYMDKSFASRICQDNEINGGVNNVESFSSEMRSYTSTDDFTSKIVVAD